MSNTVILESRNVTKTYTDAGKEVVVLQGVDLDVNQGDSISIVGSSGSGKSSLLHVLGGLDVPTDGEVLIHGKNIHEMSAKRQGDWRNKHLGFVYQFHHLLAEFTALENVAMPLLIRGMDAKKANEQAANMIEQVGLRERLEHKPSQLSGGERQRIAIARALVTRPDCILADEPTGNLDSDNAQMVYELMLDLNQKLGTALIVVTHDRDLAAKANRQLELVDGVLNKH
ncbi:lipoprotein-releasing ABC transporter ATP-binding protein LolD [Pleionea sp. CnH1-48]|uniref:lipoprotein-releasing ABC transporter ATP-binding protein LolD n=1 Tax=Pleionea sp. CnH1-48 TaxID=2954494 RepID=UPI0020972BC9|nr:lipoprotein-releasing ABC transporter ATP-binding protein LolD [Pleionea sp. CnH1-48]MCO7225847.1 lipoprotein-releasing ABC transporter ATP-binding protein LolD [Pleionea sp. CnH1-48]